MRGRCEISVNNLSKELLKALEICVKGTTSKEITTEYVVDEETGKMKAVKQKINEKTIPPNVDLLKLLYAGSKQPEDDYEKMSRRCREVALELTSEEAFIRNFEDAYKKYVEIYFGSWDEEKQKEYFIKFIETVK